MFVRVYDNANNQYYKSVVYALIMVKEASPYCTIRDVIDGQPEFVHCDAEYAVVLNSISKEFEIISRYIHDREVIANVPTLIHKSRYNVIQCDSVNWNTLSIKETEKYKVLNYSLTSVRGYEDVLNNPDFLEKILKFEKIPQSEAGVTIRQPDDSDVWKYIYTQNDALSLLNFYDEFHEAEIDKITYDEKADYTCKLTVDLTLCQGGKLRLCFEGDLQFNLRRNNEYERGMAYCNILVTDKDVLWLVDERKSSQIDDETTYVRALSLKCRWR